MDGLWGSWKSLQESWVALKKRWEGLKGGWKGHGGSWKGPRKKWGMEKDKTFFPDNHIFYKISSIPPKDFKWQNFTHRLQLSYSQQKYLAFSPSPFRGPCTHEFKRLVDAYLEDSPQVRNFTEKNLRLIVNVTKEANLYEAPDNSLNNLRNAWRLGGNLHIARCLCASLDLDFFLSLYSLVKGRTLPLSTAQVPNCYTI